MYGTVTSFIYLTFLSFGAITYLWATLSGGDSPSAYEGSSKRTSYSSCKISGGEQIIPL